MNDPSSWCAEEYDRDRPPRKPHSTRNTGGTISVACHWCGDGNTFTDTDFGRAMHNLWPNEHRNECNDNRTNWRSE